MNNKSEARPPNHEGKWQAIDIFLFSNGQQYSPPRKYHLQAEDLNWWDSTLNFLARSHFGSLHSVIELYTLDGHKIKGPLELSDGTAYVAVVPPDAFIDSGYEKYLIKASRSWEKRQAKKATTTDTPENEKTACGHFQPCCTCSKKSLGEDGYTTILGQKVACVLENILLRKSDLPVGAADKNLPKKEDEPATIFVYTAPELTTIKTPDDNIAEASVVVKPHIGSVQKLDTTDSQPPLKSIIATPRSSTPRHDRPRQGGQHTAFAKNSNGPSAQQRKNSVSKIKEGLQRQKLTKIPIKISDNFNASKQKRLSKTTQPASSMLPTIPSVPPPPSPPESSLPPIPNTFEKPTPTLKEKGLATDPANLDTFLYNKEMVVIAGDLFKNAESEIRSLHLDSNRSAVIDELISCYIIQDSVEEAVQTQSDQTSVKPETADAGVNISDSKIKVFPETSLPKNNTISCNIPLEDNFIAVINKGEAVNLNLTIELKSSETGRVQSSHIEHRQVRKISSAINVFKKKPSSKDEETTVQTKSLQSIISSINDVFAKVVVVQCACCGNNTTIPRIDTMPVYKDENGFFILMPGPPSGENQSCACGPNPENLCFDKKIMSELCLPDITRPKSRTDFPVLARDAGMVMTILNCGLPRIEAWQKNVYDAYMMTKQVAINEGQCNVGCCWSSPSQVMEKTELVVSKSEQRQSSCHAVEAFTQTEWCRVLLQVKCHDDGHYTFHLPPLEMLKFYSVQNI